MRLDARLASPILALTLLSVSSGAVITEDPPPPPGPRGPLVVTCSNTCDDNCELASCSQPNPTTGQSQTYSCPQWLSQGGDNDVDGRPWYADNCACIPNGSQTDCDADGRGDACDWSLGTYQLDSSRRNVPCKVDKDNHAGYYKIEVTYETRYVDTTACRQPPKYDHTVLRDGPLVWGTAWTEACRRLVFPYTYWWLCDQEGQNFCESVGDTYP
jgi:hypothetical protein